MKQFEYDIPNSLYQKLKKNTKLSRMFWSSNVGKCSELFDLFIRDDNYSFNDKEWVRYYFDVKGRDVLNDISNYIVHTHSCSLVDAKKYVFHRVLGQTWNGMVKEIQLMEELKLDFPKIDFRKTTHDIDENYFTDWEAYSETLLFGIQIKPISYKHMSSPFQLKSKELHQHQLKLYKHTFNVPHIIIYYQGDTFYDKEYVLNQINTILAMKINVI